MHIRYSLAALALLSALTGTAQAGVVIMGTRLVFDEAQGQRDVTVQVRNDGDQASLVQVWLDDGDATQAPSTVSLPLRLTPADPRVLQGQQSQAYRLNFAPGPGDPQLPADRESLLYFNLLDIPPAPQAGEQANYLQFAVRTRIKLFYRPKGLSGTPATSVEQIRANIENRGGKQHLVLENPTVYHVNLLKIVANGEFPLQADTLRPEGRLEVALPDARPIGALDLHWLDDHGASRVHRMGTGS